MRKVLSFALLSSGLLTIVFLAGCSSTPPPISVGLSYPATKADQGQTIQISAAVLNDASGGGVTWSLTGPGTLSAVSNLSVVYNATNIASSQTATITATSVTDPTKNAILQISVNPPPLVLFQSIIFGVTGVPYNQPLTETGGTPPFTWSVPAGALPNGLSLNPSTGVISGNPTSAGTWYFDAHLADAVGYSSENPFFSIEIHSNLPPGNPVPFVNQPLIPDTAAPGGSEFTLTVNGTGFLAGATVNLNSTTLATTFVNSHRLTATVPAPSIASAGTASLTVVNPAPGGGSSNVVYFPVATPESAVNFTEAPGSPFPAYFAIAVAAGDFNHDGKPDLAIAFNIHLQTLLGNGDGTFTQAPGSPMAIRPPIYDNFPSPYAQALALGDFNNSGQLGLAVALFQNLSAAILSGNGNGSFAQSSTFAYFQGQPTYSVAAGDFNGDGNLDLAAANGLSGQPVAVVLGYGDGAFNPVADSPFGVSNGATAIAAGDFNGDGKLDLAVSTNNPTVAGSGSIIILLGNGDGTFTQAGSPISVQSSYSIAVADFNGDGKLDLAVAGFSTSNVTILLGNGDGTFTQAPGSPIGVGTGPYALVAGDFTSSGKLGLAVANDGDATVTILLGNGDGTFTQAAGSPIPVGKGPMSLAAADFNSSGRLGLAVANLNDGTVTVLLQH